MKVVDLTGTGRGVVGFHTDLMPDGSVIGRFEVGITNADIPLGGNATGAPTVDQFQVKFDKPESVAVFIHQLTKGYNRMGFLLMQEQVRKDAIAQAQKADEKAAKQAALAGRIAQMAKELSALQGEYAELQD